MAKLRGDFPNDGAGFLLSWTAQIWIFHLLSWMESVSIIIDPSVLSFYDLAPLCLLCLFLCK